MVDFLGCNGELPGVLASLISDASAGRELFMLLNRSSSKQSFPSSLALYPSISVQPKDFHSSEKYTRMNTIVLTNESRSE